MPFEHSQPQVAAFPAAGWALALPQREGRFAQEVARGSDARVIWAQEPHLHLQWVAVFGSRRALEAQALGPVGSASAVWRRNWVRDRLDSKRPIAAVFAPVVLVVSAESAAAELLERALSYSPAPVGKRSAD